MIKFSVLTSIYKSEPYLNDYFKSIEVIGQGDQSWRSVSLLFTKKYIYYGTVCEFYQNKIYKNPVILFT